MGAATYLPGLRSGTTVEALRFVMEFQIAA
jgi:hypothetical protein